MEEYLILKEIRQTNLINNKQYKNMFDFTNNKW